MSNRQQSSIEIRAPSVRAIIAKIESDYVVTYPLNDHDPLYASDSVTFTLAAWRGKEKPVKRQVVELFGTTLMGKGWRATHAEPVIPSTQQSATGERHERHLPR